MHFWDADHYTICKTHLCLQALTRWRTCYKRKGLMFSHADLADHPQLFSSALCVSQCNDFNLARCNLHIFLHWSKLIATGMLGTISWNWGADSVFERKRYIFMLSNGLLIVIFFWKLIFFKWHNKLHLTSIFSCFYGIEQFTGRYIGQGNVLQGQSKVGGGGGLRHICVVGTLSKYTGIYCTTWVVYCPSAAAITWSVYALYINTQFDSHI